MHQPYPQTIRPSSNEKSNSLTNSLEKWKPHTITPPLEAKHPPEEALAHHYPLADTTRITKER